MKRVLILFLLFSLSGVYAQDTQELDLEFYDKPLESVLLDIEKKTGYKFYYLKEWIPDTLVSGTYNNKRLENILDELFDDTVLNYYKLDDKIILSENSVVYDDFSNGFLGTEESNDAAENIVQQQEESKVPLFYQPEDESGGITTIKIGKENTRSGVQSYTLSGRVLEKETNRPLSNVAIIIDQENKGTVTNSEGFYSINLKPGVHELTAQALGSATIKRRLIIYNDGTLNFQLSQDLEELNEVVIESESNRNVEKAFAGVSQIDVQEIKNIPLVLGERDLLKVAETLPGISKAGEGSSGFNVRGGKTDQNLILLDNGLIYNPNHFFGIFSALNPFTTGSVDIYKGSIPAQYGGRLSSVFDIKTRKGNPREFSGEGSIGPVTGNLALELPVIKDKSSLILGGRATYSDWILKSLDEESLENSQASFYDLIAKYNHQLNNKDEINATAYFSNDQFSITSDSLFAYQNRMFSLSYDRAINNDVDLSVILTNSDYKFDIEYDSDFNNNFRSGFAINDTKLKFNFDHKLNSQHLLNYGLSTKLYVLQPGETEPLGDESLIVPEKLAQEKGLESAVYISDEFEVNDKLLLNAGLRFSVFNSLGPDVVNTYANDEPKNEGSIVDETNYGNNDFVKTYSGLEYRLAARYFLLEDFSVKAGYSTTMQYIHTLSNNTTVSPTDLFKLSDFHIKPQRAQQYSLGFFKNLDQNNYELSLEGYYKTSQNILDFETGANLFLNENIETETLQGDGRSYGAELLLRKNRGDLNGWVGYTYSRSLLRLDSPYASQRVNQGEFFPSNYDKPHDFTAVLNYKITKRFSFSANLVYQTGRPVTVPIGKYDFNNSEFVVYSDRNEYRIPDYYRLDLSFNAEGNHKIEKLAHSFWNISIYNVLGRNNPYSVYFVTEDGEVQAYQSSIFSVPIPTITYNFKF